MKDPCALLYIDTWLTATAEMDADARGWYLNLILHQYDKGDLPADLEVLATLAMVRFSEFERFKQVFEQVLKQKFQPNERGRLENPRASEILRSRESFKEKRSAAGQMGYVIKLALAEHKATPGEIEHLKQVIDFEHLDTKNKQMLKQMLAHLLKLYRDGDGDKNKNKVLSWKTDYSIYLQEVTRAYETLVADPQYITEQERFNPGLDIVLSLEKAYKCYWATEAAWEHRRRSKSLKMDMKATFTNAIPLNKVFKQKDGQAARSYESKPETALRIAQANMHNLAQRIADSEK